MNRFFDVRLPLLAAVLFTAACGEPEAAERQPPVAAAPAPDEGGVSAPAPGGEVALETAAPVEGASGTAAPPAGGAQPPATPTVEPDGAKQQPAAPGAAQAERDATAEQILRRVEESYGEVRSMQADFVQDLRVPLLGTSQRSTGKLYQRRPDRFLMKFTDPAGDVIVADGRHFWMYYPSSDPKQVMRTSIAEGSEQVDLHQQFLSNPTRRYTARLDGEETVDGHRTHVLTLVPREQSPVKQLRIWVDRDDHAVRRFEMTEENESVRRIELRNLRRNVTLPDALFAFTPPKGTQVFEQ